MGGMMKPTGDHLKKLIIYEAKTGRFFWLVDCRYRVHTGDEAGCLDHRGYRIIRICGKNYRANRLAWFLMCGEWPQNQIDHINGVKGDNRWTNLRSATPINNAHNRAKNKNNTSGYRGVVWNKQICKWTARCWNHGHVTYLGSFDDAENASLAYESFSKKTRGEFHRDITPC